MRARAPARQWSRGVRAGRCAPWAKSELEVATMLIADVDTRGARPANESEADESESMTDFFLWRLSGVWDAMLS